MTGRVAAWHANHDPSIDGTRVVDESELTPVQELALCTQATVSAHRSHCCQQSRLLARLATWSHETGRFPVIASEKFLEPMSAYVTASGQDFGGVGGAQLNRRLTVFSCLLMPCREACIPNPPRCHEPGAHRDTDTIVCSNCICAVNGMSARLQSFGSQGLPSRAALAPASKSAFLSAGQPSDLSKSLCKETVAYPELMPSLCPKQCAGGMRSWMI